MVGDNGSRASALARADDALTIVKLSDFRVDQEPFSMLRANERDRLLVYLRSYAAVRDVVGKKDVAVRDADLICRLLEQAEQRLR